MDNYSFSFSGPSWPTQVRSFLSQFFDAFSAFSKHIAPTYRHDRCESRSRSDSVGQSVSAQSDHYRVHCATSWAWVASVVGALGRVTVARCFSLELKLTVLTVSQPRSGQISV
ncbi:hypothetical protein BaRGS_00005671 [Batillaria attramentaria]|uniref:Uncharacterized protein n=1 Tax=Batillaria attramentaria TaxID=370345 RepID=A0ABD0LTS6_9CAEN